MGGNEGYEASDDDKQDKGRGRRRPLSEAPLPALRPQARFGGQPPAVRAALGPEMCGQLQGLLRCPEIGSKTEKCYHFCGPYPQTLTATTKNQGSSLRKEPILSKKEKFALYLMPEKKAVLERRYREDGSRHPGGRLSIQRGGSPAAPCGKREECEADQWPRLPGPTGAGSLGGGR